MYSIISIDSNNNVTMLDLSTCQKVTKPYSEIYKYIMQDKKHNFIDGIAPFRLVEKGYDFSPASNFFSSCSMLKSRKEKFDSMRYDLQYSKSKIYTYPSIVQRIANHEIMNVTLAKDGIFIDTISYKVSPDTFKYLYSCSGTKFKYLSELRFNKAYNYFKSNKQVTEMFSSWMKKTKLMSISTPPESISLNKKGYSFLIAFSCPNCLGSSLDDCYDFLSNKINKDWERKNKDNINKLKYCVCKFISSVIPFDDINLLDKIEYNNLFITVEFNLEKVTDINNFQFSDVLSDYKCLYV